MCSYSSGRWPIPKTYVTLPLLRLSSTAMSSASLTGWYNGSTAAATKMLSTFVRAAIADVRINGDGR